MSVKETSQYDNYLDMDKRLQDDYNPGVDKLFGEVIEPVDPDKKKEIEDKPLDCFKIVRVHFANADDYEDFCRVINRMIDYDTKEIWYPEFDGSNALSMFLDDSNTSVFIDRSLLLPKKQKRVLVNPEDKYWKSQWVGMPDFTQNENAPFKSLNVKFRRHEDYRDFSRILDQDLTDATKSLWHPKPIRKPNYVYRWLQKDDERTNPRHPVYIVSKGRAHSMHTSRSLSRMKIPHFIVVEPQDMTSYDEALDTFGIRDYVTLLEAPFSNHGDGPGRARNWAWDHAISIGAKSHWVLDDNISDFYRLQENKRIRVETGVFFRVMEDFVDRYENVYIAGPQYRFFIAPDSHYPAFSINTRIYSCLLIRNDCPHRWRGRYNEDTDICLRVLKDGNCTIQFNAFLQGKMATQTVKGGNTEEFYHKEFADSKKDGYNAKGTINKSQMLVDMHPDVTTLVWKYGRWHHHVDYTRFKSNFPKKVTDTSGLMKVDNYGMYLIDNYEGVEDDFEDM